MLLETAAVVGLGVLLMKRAKNGAISSPELAYRNGQPAAVTLVPIDNAGHLLEVNAASAFVSMRDAAAADGVFLVVDSAFRTWDEQQRLYDDYQAGVGALAAPPGYSNHQSGVAVDIDTAKGSNAAFRWLTDNAERFGFTRTVPSEPWHWEYRP